MIELSYKDFLVDQSLGTYGDDLYVSEMPEQPNNAVCLYLSTAPQLTEHQRYDIDQSGVKIMIRGTHSFCQAKMLAIQKVLPQMDGTWNSIEIHETFIQTPFAFIENDDKGRAIYTGTFESEYSIGATSRTAT